jgi:hypothetical protein
LSSCLIVNMSWHAVQVENISSILCEVPDHKRIDAHLLRKALAYGCERIQGCIGRIGSRTRMGATACSSESGCGKPSGTARPNIEPVFRTPGNHAASSAISSSSFSFAAFAQPCHFGIAVALPSTYTSCGVIGSPPCCGINAQCGLIVL